MNKSIWLGFCCRPVLTLSLIKFRYVIFIFFYFSTNTCSFAAVDYLIASCDGPGGYCSPGNKVIVRYQSGGNVLAGKRGDQFDRTDIVLAYCPTPDGTNVPITRYCSDVVRVPISGSGEGQPWSTWVGSVTGTFTLPFNVSSTTSLRCVTAYLSDGNAWGSRDPRPFGTTIPSTGNTPAMCSGYAPPPPPPNLCYVNSGNPINVEFGTVERLDISTAAGGGNDKQKTFTVNCQGVDNHGINIRLNMTPTSWSPSQIATSNGVLGVSVAADGKVLNNNDSFNMSVNGSASSTLTFSLLRDPNKAATDIATGAFNASASLIVTEP